MARNCPLTGKRVIYPTCMDCDLYGKCDDVSLPTIPASKTASIKKNTQNNQDENKNNENN